MSDALLISMVTLVVTFASPILAHLVGWIVARSLRVRHGSIREWMPSIPDHIEVSGRAEARWERRRRAIEARLLPMFAQGVSGAEAGALAAQLGEDPEVVAGTLGHLREEIPCRLRVTRSGKLLHDFAAEDIRSLRRRRRASWPLRAALFLLGVLANLGAVWPVLLCVLVATVGLAAIAATGDAAAIGVVSLLVVASLFGINLVAGKVAHLLLTPGWGGPRLGATIKAEPSFAHLQKDQSAGRSFFEGKKSSSSKADSGFFDLGGFGDFDAGCIGAIAVALLVAVLAAGTFALFVFARGVWRAVTGAGMPSLEVSPTQWVRSSQPSDRLERLIPTNDLVLRVLRVLRRMASHTHPRDATIVGRVMARARKQHGRIAALEIAMMEGVDLDEATAIGARLSGRASGAIDVTGAGELDFVFPSDALTKAPGIWDDDLNAEYIDFHPGKQRVTRRGSQELDRLPVNLPGISWGHVQSADRLAAGTVLMMVTGVAAVNLVPDLPGALVLAVDFILPLLTLGTFALAGALRYAVSALAKIGVRRDIRRVAFLEIRRELSAKSVAVKFDPLVSQLLSALRPAWAGVTRDLIVKELEGACIDLDLEPDMQRIADVGGLWYSLDTLRERLEDLERHREDAGEVQFDAASEAASDVVVSDSQVEPDRVRSLA